MKLFILLRDNLRISFQMISSHKLRSFLSVLGIVFGILTLLVTLAIGEGTRRKIMRTIEAMGANLIYVSPQAVSQDGQNLEFNPLTWHESERLSQLEGILGYAPLLSSASLMRVGPSEKVIAIDGVTPSYALVRELSLERGRFIADEDVIQSSRIAVMGGDLAQVLFPNRNPLGGIIHLWDSSFKVVGVLKKKGRTLGVNFDEQILMPITTLQELQGRRGELQGIWIRAKRSDLTRDVMNQAQDLLAREDLEIWDQESLLAKKNKMAQAFKWALGSMAVVSLLIGGIGVMNVLLASVAERVKEIGIRKAVGATSWDILFQFMFESFVLTAVGASLGILLGMGIGDSVVWVLNSFLPTSEKWEAVLSWNAVGISLHFTFWVGLIFGLYPAWKAAKLDPCQALTYF